MANTDITESWLETLLVARELRAIERRLDREPFGTVAPAFLRARAELAMCGRGPASDLVVCARHARRDAWPSADRYTRAAARVLALAGAAALAKEFRADAAAEEAPPEIDAYAAPETAAEEAAIARARGEHAHASELAARAYELAPTGDSAAAYLVAAGSDAWAAGDVDGAKKWLEKAREIAPPAHELLARIEKDPERARGGPSWSMSSLVPAFSSFADGRGVVEALHGCSIFAPREVDVPDGALFTMAHLARHLRREGVAILRVAVDAATAAKCHAAGAIVLLEIERPLGRGFRLVRAVDAVAELWLLQDPNARGAELVGDRARIAQGALFGNGALVILGRDAEAIARRAALAEAGVVHDARFDGLDACDVDADGRAPPRALVFQTTRALLEKDPQLEPARRRLGEEILAAWRTDDVKSEEFVAWYAEARERFPRAEWPAQMYAQYLETQSLYAESGIAHANAERADPRDWRNAMGHGRAQWAMGRTKDAEGRFRAAATTGGAATAAYIWLARCALRRSDLGGAEVCAQLEDDLHPNEVSAPSLLANVYELRDEADRALATMANVRKLQPRDPWVVSRLGHGHARAGRIGEARAIVSSFLDSAPSGTDPQALVTLSALAVRLAWMDGAPDEAWSVALRALEKQRFHDDLIGVACVVLSTSFGPEKEAAHLDELIALCPRSNAPLGTLIAKLIDRGMPDQAIVVVERTPGWLADDVTRDWFQARTRLHAGRALAERAQIVALLERVLVATPNFEANRVLLGGMLVNEEPDRALTVAAAEGTYHVASLWEIRARALSAKGDAAAADDLHARISALPPDAIGRTTSFLRRAHLDAVSDALVEGARARHPDDPQLALEWMATQMARGDAAGALETLTRARETQAPDTIAWGIATEVAARAPAWELLVTSAREQRKLLRDTRTLGDVWIQRALLAGAELALGRSDERDAVRAAVPNHPDALSILARIEAKVGHARAADDEAALGACAPGARERLHREEVLPWNTLR